LGGSHASSSSDNNELRLENNIRHFEIGGGEIQYKGELEEDIEDEDIDATEAFIGYLFDGCDLEDILNSSELPTEPRLRFAIVLHMKLENTISNYSQVGCILALLEYHGQ